MTRHDTPKYGMARHAKIWHGTWNHDMAWHGTGPPCCWDWTTLGKNKAMPFLPQAKCPAEWWSSKLINRIIKNHRKITKNLKIPKIQSRRNFRPKFEVGLWSSKNATMDWVALFFPPTVESQKGLSSCCDTAALQFQYNLLTIVGKTYWLALMFVLKSRAGCAELQVFTLLGVIILLSS